jgi:hypothetical protein
VITVADDLVCRFAPIGLDELGARAGLLTRIDRKYVLPAADLPALLAGLPGDVRVLDIDGLRRFAYRSAYFDTPRLDSYLGSARRRRRRFKLRIRTYLDSGTQFLEVKTRGARGATVKQRFPYAGESTVLPPADRACAAGALAAAGVPDVGDRFGLTLTTDYERLTLFVPSTASRVTIDRHLTWSLPTATALPSPTGPAVPRPTGVVLALPGQVIVETKSARSCSPADRLLWSRGHRPLPVSKYATGLAALRPDLPANRWCPVLRRHFATTETSR